MRLLEFVTRRRAYRCINRGLRAVPQREETCNNLSARVVNDRHIDVPVGDRTSQYHLSRVLTLEWRRVGSCGERRNPAVRQRVLQMELCSGDDDGHAG